MGKASGWNRGPMSIISVHSLLKCGSIKIANPQMWTLILWYFRIYLLETHLSYHKVLLHWICKYLHLTCSAYLSRVIGCGICNSQGLVGRRFKNHLLLTRVNIDTHFNQIEGCPGIDLDISTILIAEIHNFIRKHPGTTQIFGRRPNTFSNMGAWTHNLLHMNPVL